jgi:hypothetical protein
MKNLTAIILILLFISCSKPVETNAPKAKSLHFCVRLIED